MLRATIDLEPKIRTAEEMFARLLSDHTLAYLSPGNTCFSNVLFSTSFL